jgi:Cellulase (glycosyl hydrolase family 5)
MSLFYIMITPKNRVLAFCKANKINALRIPISLDLALDQQAMPGSCAECPAGKTAYDMLDILFTKAANAGMLILLDMHRLDKVY